MRACRKSYKSALHPDNISKQYYEPTRIRTLQVSLFTFSVQGNFVFSTERSGLTGHVNRVCHKIPARTYVRNLIALSCG